MLCEAPEAIVASSRPPLHDRRAVQSTGSAAPLGSHAAEIYAKFAADHADKDFSAVIEMIRNG
jgi:hypothetical protein